MRLLILAAAAITFPAIASAQSYPADDYAYDEVSDSLPSPREIDRTSDRLHRVLDALMDVRVGPLVEAVDPNSRVRRDETLGDIAGRDDPYFEERMHASVGAAKHGMTAMMAAFARIAPALERSIDDIERSAEEAARDYRYRD